MKTEHVILCILILLCVFLFFRNKICNIESFEKNNKQNIAICVLFRNNIKYLTYFFEKMKELELLYNVEYFIYENNSTDGTKQSLKEFMINRQGTLISTDIENYDQFGKIISMDRGNKMASFRNHNKKSAKKCKS